MDPNFGKATGKERTVSLCKESLPTSCGPHRKRFLEVLAEIHVHMTFDKNSFLQEEAASAKHKLMSVGGYTDTPLDLVATGNTDEKHRNGLPPVRVDDALFRKSLVTTSHMGQTTVCMDKGTVLGKRDTTLPPRYIHQENYWDMDEGIKKDIWSVMENFAKAPGGKDLTKMKESIRCLWMLWTPSR
jgi:hypothetical protein